MNTVPSHDYQRVYVWEQPIRWFHWINAGGILVLGVSGWLMAHPPALLTSTEASAGYWFGAVRFAHFAMAYVFTANLAFRIYWAFAGNKFASWRNFLPLTKAQFRQVWQVLQVGVGVGALQGQVAQPAWGWPLIVLAAFVFLLLFLKPVVELTSVRRDAS